ncbi:glycine-rich domain-containing protein [Ohtaekwangia kribbensis]|uniref:Glycine-rich domain-containing protein n=1 Tax=Ohtaekwangia kribbensis TaxID=688913 RepID=A0ABW3JY79_9BACT
MTEEQRALWLKVRAFELDDPESAFPFSSRLARENGWTLEYTLRTIEEYKKFMFLICVAGYPLTPSDQVDQVWHLHLLYTYSYWKEFCATVLKREVHHGPTKGGKQEGEKFNDWYTKTLDTYTAIFQEPPPADIWPVNQKRFSEINYQRINLDKNWIIKKPFIL